MNLDLLLRRPDGRGLLEGLDPASLILADRPEALEHAKVYRRHDDSPNAMDQGWGVLYPEDQPELLEAITELVSWRREAIAAAAEDGRRAVVPAIVPWAIGPDRDAQRFLAADYRAVAPRQRPGYLLILGDFDRISFEFQRDVGREAFVGRLCLPALADYETYARKLVRLERAHSPDGVAPRLVLLSTSTIGRPDPALDTGHEHLVQPLARDFRNPELGLSASGTPILILGPRGDVAQAVEWPGVRVELGSTRPTVLLSLAHGLGDPSWSPEVQRERQGQLGLGGGEVLSLDDVHRRPFLPGGVWFNYACFSGGTPKRSAFEPWLRQLVGARARYGVPDVLATLARGEAFVARQAQLALANPQGPVAVIGHGDLAFTYSFLRAEGQELRRRGRVARGARRRPSHDPILGVLESLVAGSRVGVAQSRLRPALTEAEQVLLGHWQRRKAGESALVRSLLAASQETRDPSKAALNRALIDVVEAVRGEVGDGGVTLDRLAVQAERSPKELLAMFSQALDQTRQVQIGHNWMARHDLAGWFVLGDPAARVGQSPTGEVLEAPADRDLDALEQAVAAYAYFVVARQERSADEVARAHGLDAEALRGHYERWSRAGRRALS